MLHRAATTAYSWWWASHVRTKQSKWLEQNLQDMEEKIKFMLMIIEQDGDSFAKRAEMYYKKRPELIESVEETYKSYRALAERYDHLSKDLQSANRTIATVFPEQVQLALESDDDDSSIGSTAPPDQFSAKSSSPGPPPKNFPKPPKLPKPAFKGSSMLASKREQLRRSGSNVTSGSLNISGLTKDEACKEIDTLQKDILTWQTEKEFIKSAYESALNKFLELESKIADSQGRVCVLQDEFGVGTVMEDHEARALMAGSALKSCSEALAKLQEEQQSSMEEVKREYERIKEAHERLTSLKKLGCKENYTVGEEDRLKAFGERLTDIEPEEGEDVEVLRERIRERLKMGSDSVFTEPEMADKIDELVEKIVHLESLVCSYNALFKRLREEIDALLDHIKTLEEQKQPLEEGSVMSMRLKELEEELIRVHMLNEDVLKQKKCISQEITEAGCNIDLLKEKLHDVKPDGEGDFFGVSKESKVEQEVRAQKEDTKFETEKEKNVCVSDLSQEEMKEEKDERDQKQIQCVSETEQEMKEAKDEEDQKQIHCVLSDPKLEMKEEDERDQKKTHLFSDSQQELKEEEEEDEEDQKKTHIFSEPRQEIKEGEDEEDQQQNVSNITESNFFSDITPEEEEEEGGLNWRRLYLNNMEDREKILVEEYTMIFRDYKDMKTKLNEMEKQHRDQIFEMASHVRELRNTMAEKDEEIQRLLKTRSDLHAKKGRENLALPSKEEENSDQEEENKNKITELQAIGGGNMDLSVKEEQKDNGNKDHQVSKNNSVDKNIVAEKDEEIQMLREKLLVLQANRSEGIASLLEEQGLLKSEDQSNNNETNSFTISRNTSDRKPLFHHLYDRDAFIKQVTNAGENKEAIEKRLKINFSRSMSGAKGRLRVELDNLLEGNLDFWLRFSTAVHQIQKLRTSVKDLQAELGKLKQTERKENMPHQSLKSETRPLYKHLREIQTELTLWLEHSVVFQEELNNRFSSLNNIQDEITRVSSGKEGEKELSDYKAAKFHGEILNMKHENTKVAEELQAGIHCAKELKQEVGKLVAKLNKEFGFSDQSVSHSSSIKNPFNKPRIPLHTFLFGVKLKRHRQRPSLLACVNPVLPPQPEDEDDE